MFHETTKQPAVGLCVWACHPVADNAGIAGLQCRVFPKIMEKTTCLYEGGDGKWLKMFNDNGPTLGRKKVHEIKNLRSELAFIEHSECTLVAVFS
jgi:hypothetical protein